MKGSNDFLTLFSTLNTQMHFLQILRDLFMEVLHISCNCEDDKLKDNIKVDIDLKFISLAETFKLQKLIST